MPKKKLAPQVLALIQNQIYVIQQEGDQYRRRYKIIGMAPKIDELVKQAKSEQLSYKIFLIQLF